MFYIKIIKQNKLFYNLAKKYGTSMGSCHHSQDASPNGFFTGW